MRVVRNCSLLLHVSSLRTAMGRKRSQSTPISAPESGLSASEHVSTSAGDKISLDDVIAKLRAADNEDKRGEEILAAATTLRDSSGRDRKEAPQKDS